MTIGLTEEHRDLRDAVRAFTSRQVTQAVVRAAVDAAAEQAPAFWDDLAGQGLLGLHLPEDAGGAGYGLVELAVVEGDDGVERLFARLAVDFVPDRGWPAPVCDTVGRWVEVKRYAADHPVGQLIATAARESAAKAGGRRHVHRPCHRRRGPGGG